MRSPYLLKQVDFNSSDTARALVNMYQFVWSRLHPIRPPKKKSTGIQHYTATGERRGETTLIIICLCDKYKPKPVQMRWTLPISYLSKGETLIQMSGTFGSRATAGSLTEIMWIARTLTLYQEMVDKNYAHHCSLAFCSEKTKPFFFLTSTDLYRLANHKQSIDTM